MSNTILTVDNVSVKYRLTEQKVDDLKDYLNLVQNPRGIPSVSSTST